MMPAGVELQTATMLVYFAGSFGLHSYNDVSPCKKPAGLLCSLNVTDMK
jgi:hypothetical protein